MKKRSLFTLLLSALLLILTTSLQGKELFVYLLNVTAQKELTRSIFDKQTIRVSNISPMNNSLSEVLSHTSGLDIRNYGAPGSLSQVSIRGGSAEQTLLAVEDVPMNSSQNGSMDLSLFPSSAFSSVDIIKGGGSSIYGANAASGYINFTSMRPSSTYAAVSSFYGSFGHFRNNIEGGGVINNKIFLRGLVEYEFSKNNFAYTNSGLSLQRTNAGFTNLYLFGSAEYKNADLSSKLTMFFDNKKAGMPEDAVMQNPKAYQKDRTIFTSWKNMFFFPLFTETIISWMRSENRYNDPYQAGGAVDDLHITDQWFSSVSQEYEKGMFSFRYGAEEKFNKINSDTIGMKERNLLSPFLSSQADLFHKQLKISVRGRYEWSTVYNSVFNYNAGFNADLIFKTVLHANYGTSFREPTFNDLYWPKDYFAKGNNGLRPETSKNVDVGIENQLLKRLIFKLSFFMNDYDDLIQWTQGAGGKWSPVNISRARDQGGEADTSFLWNQFLTVSFNYMKLYAVNLSAGEYYGKYLIYKPFDRINVSIIVNYWKIKIMTLYHYAGFYYATQANTVSPWTMGSASQQLSVVLQINLLYGLTFALSGDNLLNDRTPTMNNHPIPGRAFSMEMKYLYDFKKKKK